MLKLRVKREQDSKVNGLKLREEVEKKLENPKGIDVKNRFSILDQMNEESNIVRYREDRTNDIV